AVTPSVIGGTITPSAAANYTVLDTVTFTYAPDAGYHFSSVTVDGVVNTDSTMHYTFAGVTAPHTIDVLFDVNTYTINSSAVNGSIIPSGPNNFLHGDTATYFFTPSLGMQFDSLVVDGNSVPDSISSYTFAPVTAAHSVTAYFSPLLFDMIAIGSANGTVTPADTTVAAYGDSLVYTITPSTGYHTVDILVDGAPVGPAATYTFKNITADHTIEGVFAIDTFILSASTVGVGSISPSGSVVRNYGDTSTYTIFTDAAHQIDSVIVDGVNVGPVSSYDFNGISSDHSITAYFSIRSYTVTPSYSGNGSYNPPFTMTVNYGDSIHYDIIPAAHHHIDSVVIDGMVNLGPVTGYTFLNVTSDRTIMTYFAPDSFYLTVIPPTGGSISPPNSRPLVFTDSLVYTFTPDIGHHLMDVLVDGISQGPVPTYLFDDITADHTLEALFAIDTFTVTVTTAGNGTTTLTGTTLFTYGDTVDVSFLPSPGHHVTDLIVNGISTGPAIGYGIDGIAADAVVHVVFAIDTFQIAAQASPGGSISPSGTSSFVYGDTVMYTVAPSIGSVLDSIVVDGQRTDSIASYTFIGLTADHQIDAYFSVQQFTVTGSVSGNGSVTPPGAVQVPFGDSIMYSIIPSTGYHIDSVVVDGSINLGAVGTYTFTNVTANHSLQAYFGLDYYPLITGAVNGTVTRSPLDSTHYPYGFNVTLTAVPDTGYHFTGWSGDTVSGMNPLVVPMFAPRTVTANFEKDTFLITATVVGNGTISPAGTSTVPYGDSLAYTITADLHHRIDSVLVDGSLIGTDSMYTFTNVTAPHTISAYFSAITHTITATAAPGGAISPSGTFSVAQGSDLTLTIAPDSAHITDSVVVDGVNAGSIPAFTFFAVDSAHSIAAYFSIKKYPVVATGHGNGTITPSDTTLVQHGSSITFSIHPQVHYQTDSVVVNGVQVVIDTFYTFSNVIAASSIHAYFSPVKYPVTTTAVNGTVLRTPDSASYTYGTSVTFVPVPSFGYVFNGWTGDTVTAKDTITVTVIGVRSYTASFVKKQYSILATSSANGTITPSGNITVLHGDSAVFTMNPAPGYRIDTVKVDSVIVGTMASYTFLNVTAHHTIHAAFGLIPNVAPVFTSVLQDTTIAEMQPLQFTVQASDPDAGDTVRYSLVNPPVGMTLGSLNGILAYSPTYTDSGTYSFMIRATDTRNAADSVSVVLKVQNVNRAPLVTIRMPDTTIVMDVPFQFTLAATDPDGDAVRYIASSIPAGSSLDSMSGLYTWTPSIADTGTASFRMTVRDLFGAFTADTALITVRKANRLPVFTAVPADPFIAEMKPYQFQYKATDPDNDTVRFALAVGPAGLTVDSLGLLKWIPTYQQAGQYPVIVRAFDTVGSVFDTTLISVVNTNRKPQFLVTMPDTVIVEDTLYQFSYAASDSDGDALQFGLISSPAGMTVDAQGTIRWTPTMQQRGTHPFF
ncbi:MAG: hypothetical protein HUU02_16295, partial [Bacteroidetes bacterium]|nr:hypothetical protein [Bacteroidota bacterium]